MAQLRQQVRIHLHHRSSKGAYVSAATGHHHQGRLLLATATSYGAVVIWEVEAEQITTIIWPDHGESSVAIARGADGRTVLATVSTRQVSPLIRVWDAYEGRLRLAVDGNGANVIALGHDERGRLLIAGGGTWEGLVRVWDAETGQLRCTLAGHVGVRRAPVVAPSGALVAIPGLPKVCAVAFSPQGGLLASGGVDGVRLWDSSDGRALALLPAGSGGVESLAFGTTTQGPLLLAGGGVDGLIRVWDAGSGVLLHAIAGHGGRAVCVAFGEDAEGRLLLGSSGPDGTIRIWDARTGAARLVVGPRMKPPQGRVWLPDFLSTLSTWELAFGATSDGQLLLISADGDGRARAYDALTGELRYTLIGSVPSARSVALGRSDAERLVVVVGDDTGVLHRFDALTGEPLGTIDDGEVAADRLAVGVDDQGRTVLASSTFSGTIQVRDLDTGVSRWELPGDDRGFWTQVATGHGSDGALLLASAGRDQTLRTRDLRTGRLLREEVRAALVWSVVIGPGVGGRAVVVTGDAHGLVRVQDPVDLALLDILTGPDRRIQCVAIGADESGRPLVAAGDDAGLVWIWGLGPSRSGQAVVGRGHTGEVRSLTFCTDGDGRVRLATVADDRTLRLWNPTTGAVMEVQHLAGAPYSVAAGMTPDGTPLLAIALVTGEVIVWRWDS